MKKSVSPAMIAIATAIALVVICGLYYKFMGSGATPSKSAVASPYGLPKAGEGFATPPPGGSGVNTITGEPLSSSVKEKENHPFPGSSSSPGAASTPSLPAGSHIGP